MAHMPLHSGPPATRSGPSMRGAASAAARVSAGGDIAHGHVDAHGTSRQRGQRVSIHPLTFGHVALALVPGAGAPLKQTLLALRGGAHLAEGDGPGGSDAAGPAGPGAVGDERGELGAGSGRPPADPAHPAPVGERGGRCRPVDRGHETIQLRETPGNLSGSGSETHQHFSPAGANCCQSLLLDPDDRIGIDLHKRLLLLVTGRGE